MWGVVGQTIAVCGQASPKHSRSNNLLFFTGGSSGQAGTSMATSSGVLRETCGSNTLFKLDPAGALLLERGLPGTPLGFD